MGPVAESTDDGAARPLNRDDSDDVQDADHVKEPNQLRAAPPQVQSGAAIRCAPVGIQEEVRTTDIDERRTGQVDHQGPAPGVALEEVRQAGGQHGCSGHVEVAAHVDHRLIRILVTHVEVKRAQHGGLRVDRAIGAHPASFALPTGSRAA
jgi:hypothetical protein